MLDFEPPVETEQVDADDFNFTENLVDEEARITDYFNYVPVQPTITPAQTRVNKNLETDKLRNLSRKVYNSKEWQDYENLVNLCSSIGTRRGKKE